MKTTLYLILTLSLFVLTCTNNPDDFIPEEIIPVIKECPDGALTASNINDPLEYEIIDAIINEFYSEESFIHIMNKAKNVIGSTEDIQSFVDNNDFTVSESLLDSYVVINQGEFFWGNTFENGVLYSEEEHDCFRIDNSFFTESYLAKYPSTFGRLAFSRPSLEADKAFIEYYQFPVSGGPEGYIVHLEKVDEKWQVTYRITTLVT